MDVFLMRVTAKHQLELRRGDHFANDMQDVVADNAFGSGEITNAHFDDPAFDIADLVGAPLFDILLHGHILRLPVVVLHGFVEIVRPLVFERQNVEEHRVATIDHALGGNGLFGLFAIEVKGAVSKGDGGSDGVGGHGCLSLFDGGGEKMRGG